MQVDVLSPLKKEEKAALAKCLTESCHEASLDLLVMFIDVYCTASQCRLSGSNFSLLRTSSFPLGDVFLPAKTDAMGISFVSLGRVLCEG